MATLAPVLRQGRADINTTWPARLTAKRGYDSDGWIGDSNHKPPSDHIPDGNGFVHAIDIDVDMVDATKLLAAILRHPATRYAIYKDKIYHVRNGFKAARYTGSYHNHIHWSIEHTNAARNSPARLGLVVNLPTGTTTATGGMVKFPVLRRNPGVVSAAVKTLQRAARALGGGLTIDGRFGNNTRNWVTGFQQRHGLIRDGVVGPQMWTALAQALLNRHGHGLAVDGRWGPKTRAATAAFQKAKGLTADGIFGPKTLAAATA